MTVFLVIGVWDYEGDMVCGCAETMEEAEKMRDAAKNDHTYNDVKIEEWKTGEYH